MSFRVADLERFAQLHTLGCIVCLRRHTPRYCDVHHLVEGSRRLGHQFTIGLCEWHHRGVPIHDGGAKATEEIFGPSLARSKREFVRAFGSERRLLRFTNLLLRISRYVRI